jgi:CheY-like chemotaxis protein
MSIDPLSFSSSPIGILVVDDEAPVRALLEAGLRQYGFTLWMAPDGYQALEIYRQHQDAIALVLLDVRMPGLDGPQTLARLRQIRPEVRCCFMSGHTGAYSEQGLLDLGAVHVFRKPFQLAELVQTLRWLADVPEPPPP